MTYPVLLVTSSINYTNIYVISLKSYLIRIKDFLPVKLISYCKASTFLGSHPDFPWPLLPSAMAGCTLRLGLHSDSWHGRLYTHLMGEVHIRFNPGLTAAMLSPWK